MRQINSVRRGRTTRVRTVENHDLHVRDKVVLDGVRAAEDRPLPRASSSSDVGLSGGDATPAASRGMVGRSSSELPASISDITDLNTLGELRIVLVPGPREFFVEVDSRRCPACGLDGTASVAVNMYKLCSEVVIPITTLEERVCRLASPEDLDALCGAFQSDTDLTVNHPVQLSDGTLLPSGLTLHGRLGPNGCFRRRYWSSGGKRSEWWAKRGEGKIKLDHFQEGWAELEDKVGHSEDLAVGDVLVFRRGTSYSECCHDGLPVDVYLSHYWGEPCKDLLATLQHHEDDMKQNGSVDDAGLAYWICTLANNQHRIDLGSRWEDSPFYSAMRSLRETAGCVLMAVGPAASTLTRIWCIFEMYVCASLDLPLYLYSSDGKIADGGQHAQAIIKRVSQMDFKRASASVDSDKAMILRAIEELEGGFERVEWTVKRLVTDFASFLCCSQRAEHPITGEPLSLDMGGGDMMPVRILRQGSWLSLRRSYTQTAEDVAVLLQQGHFLVLEAPAGSGKSVLTKLIIRHSTQHAGVLSVRVPIAQLAQVARDVTVGPDGSIDLLSAWAKRRFRNAADRLVEEPYLLVLDGLDEAGDEAFEVLAWLRQFLRRKARRRRTLRCGVLITSRAAGVKVWRRDLRAMGFEFMSTAPLKHEDVIAAAGSPQHEWRVAVALAGMRLRAELWNTPLMACLFVDLIGTGARLANVDGVGILRHFFERLLPSAVTAVRLRQVGGEPITQPALRIALLKLAWLKSVDVSRFVGREDVQRAFAEDLDHDGVGEVRKIKEEAGHWAAAVWSAACLGELRLLDVGEGEVQFLHLRLQEFLAAEYVWLEGNDFAFRCVSGGGRRGDGIDNPRFDGVRRLLVLLLKDGTARPRALSRSEAWFMLCCAAMSDSIAGTRCALQFCKPGAAAEVLARIVFGPVRPHLYTAAELARGIGAGDMVRMMGLVWRYGALGLGAGVGAPVAFLAWAVAGNYAMRVRQMFDYWWIDVGAPLCAVLFALWWLQAVQLLRLQVRYKGGRIFTLLPMFRFDWERRRLEFLGYGFVRMRADDVNLNRILYEAHIKFTLVPVLWAIWASSCVKFTAMKVIIGAVAFVSGLICTALHAVLASFLMLSVQLLWLFCLMPVHALVFKVLKLQCARQRAPKLVGTSCDNFSDHTDISNLPGFAPPSGVNVVKASDGDSSSQNDSFPGGVHTRPLVDVVQDVGPWQLLRAMHHPAGSSTPSDEGQPAGPSGHSDSGSKKVDDVEPIPPPAMFHAVMPESIFGSVGQVASQYLRRINPTVVDTTPSRNKRRPRPCVLSEMISPFFACGSHHVNE